MKLIEVYHSLLDYFGPQNWWPTDSLKNLLRPSGFYNLKTERLLNFLKFFIYKYGGCVEKMNRCDFHIVKLGSTLCKSKPQCKGCPIEDFG